MAERLWLDVPFVEKDEAKTAGARWDPEAKRWFAPRAELLPGLARWRPDPAHEQQRRHQPTPRPPPEVFPGEDREFGRGLFVDLVPSSCWFTNVRSCVDPSQWDGLRKMVYRRAGNRCEACGASGVRLEAHERWAYDAATATQHLRRLICLCADCHQATHFGFATIRGKDGEARAHLAQVNGWSESQTRRHIDEAAEVWQQRSRVDWSLDLTMLTDAGIKVRRPPDPAQRRQQGQQRPPVERTPPRPPSASAGTPPPSHRPSVAEQPPPAPRPQPAPPPEPLSPAKEKGGRLRRWLKGG